MADHGANHRPNINPESDGYVRLHSHDLHDEEVDVFTSEDDQSSSSQSSSSNYDKTSNFSINKLVNHFGDEHDEVHDVMSSLENSPRLDDESSIIFAKNHCNAHSTNQRYSRHSNPIAHVDQGIRIFNPEFASDLSQTSAFDRPSTFSYRTFGNHSRNEAPSLTSQASLGSQWNDAQSHGFITMHNADKVKELTATAEGLKSVTNRGDCCVIDVEEHDDETIPLVPGRELARNAYGRHRHSRDASPTMRVLDQSTSPESGIHKPHSHAVSLRREDIDSLEAQHSKQNQKYTTVPTTVTSERSDIDNSSEIETPMKALRRKKNRKGENQAILSERLVQGKEYQGDKGIDEILVFLGEAKSNSSDRVKGHNKSKTTKAKRMVDKKYIGDAGKFSVDNNKHLSTVDSSKSVKLRETQVQSEEMNPSDANFHIEYVKKPNIVNSVFSNCSSVSGQVTEQVMRNKQLKDKTLSQISPDPLTFDLGDYVLDEEINAVILSTLSQESDFKPVTNKKKAAKKLSANMNVELHVNKRTNMLNVNGIPDQGTNFPNLEPKTKPGPTNKIDKTGVHPGGATANAIIVKLRTTQFPLIDHGFPELMEKQILTDPESCSRTFDNTPSSWAKIALGDASKFDGKTAKTSHSAVENSTSPANIGNVNPELRYVKKSSKPATAGELVNCLTVIDGGISSSQEESTNSSNVYEVSSSRSVPKRADFQENCVVAMPQHCSNTSTDEQVDTAEINLGSSNDEKSPLIVQFLDGYHDSCDLHLPANIRFGFDIDAEAISSKPQHYLTFGFVEPFSKPASTDLLQNVFRQASISDVGNDELYFYCSRSAGDNLFDLEKAAQVLSKEWKRVCTGCGVWWSEG